MSARSLIDSMRSLSPVSDVDAAAAFGAAGREELLEGVARLPFGRAARPRRAARRRRPIVVALAVVVAIATTAATWAVLRAPARETTSVQCLIRGSDAIIPSTSGDPAHDCALDYKREFGTAPPALVAYDNALGGVTVLPQSATPPKGWKPIRSQDIALIELQDSLDDYINGLNSGCLDDTAATALAQAKLSRLGFAGWKVAVRSANGTGLCTSANVVDPATKTVTLIPVAPAGQATTFAKLADKLRPLTKSCVSLPAAAAAVRAAAEGLAYQLDTVKDNSLRCAAIYETVGGTIFLTVRGPRRQ